MKIKYLGHSSFKIQGKTSTGENVTVITDPFNSKYVGIPYKKQEADIVTVSHEHEDHNFIENIKGKHGDEYFLINTPGEYELSGLRIFGIRTYHDEKEGAERGQNTMVVFDFEEARVAHLGDLGHKLVGEALESLDNVDILLVPVGGFYTIDAKTAINVTEAVEPKIVIPMHYKTNQHTSDFDKISDLEEFKKEANGIISETLDELVIKSKSDLPNDLNIVYLNIK